MSVRRSFRLGLYRFGLFDSGFLFAVFRQLAILVRLARIDLFYDRLLGCSLGLVRVFRRFLGKFLVVGF